MRRTITVLMSAAACAVWAAAPAGAATTTWTVQATPSPAGSVINGPALLGVSCPTAASCFAVGTDSNAVTSASQPLAEHWNGRTWALQSVPNPDSSPLPGNVAGDAQLVSVACPSATSCIAVGSHDVTSDGDSAMPVALAEHWNGSAWTIQATPIPSGSDESSMSSVSCTSAANCNAVGSQSGTDYLAPLAEHWNGSAWAVQNAPDPHGGSTPPADSVSFLTGVSCGSATSCIAVGGDGTGLLTELWNGKAWAVQTAAGASQSDGAGLNAVSCVSSTACAAVGFGPGNSTLAQQWNGSAWTIQATPDTAGNNFSSVSCVSPATCTAVGNSNGGTLAERN